MDKQTLEQQNAELIERLQALNAAIDDFFESGVHNLRIDKLQAIQNEQTKAIKVIGNALGIEPYNKLKIT